MRTDIPPLNQEATKKPEKIKQLFGHCFEISKFEDGDLIPVGGESIFSGEANIQIEGDFENFKEFLQETQDMANKYDLPKLKEWLSSQVIEIDEKLFAELFAFTKNFEQKYPDNPERSETRKKTLWRKR